MKHKRIKFIESLIKKNEKVLDVGTDHAFLPIYLLLNNKTKNITASDLNEKPLSFAKENIKKYNLENKISLLKMNGIEKIKKNEFNTIVIAGMGGLNIVSIIKNIGSRYIIHATNNIFEVRKKILKIGYFINNEWVIKEGKIFNVIIEALPGKTKYSEKEIYLGPILINKFDNETIQYQNYIYNILEKNAFFSKNFDLNLNQRIWLREKIWIEKN